MSDTVSSTQTRVKPDTTWFTQSRFGMFIHWGLYSLAARHEWAQTFEKTPTEVWAKYADVFDPDLYDPVEWARLAKAAGMKYVVLTAKHHEGFCLWDSKFTDFKVTNTPCGKDVLRAFVDAFRAEGIKIGIYYSLLDWHHPDFTVDFHHPLRDSADARAANAQRDFKRYAMYMRDQVEELLTQYGEISVVWYDFSYPRADGDGKTAADWEAEELLALTRRLQPGILVDNRLDIPGGGDFETPEQFQPAKAPTDADGNPVVWEGCQTFSGSWGYFRDEYTWKSVPQLLGMLIDGVSKGGNLLLNVGPTGRGELDPRAVERLQGMGSWMRYHSRSIYGCGPAPEAFTPPLDCRYTYHAPSRRLYVHLLAWPFKHLHLPGLAGKVRYAQFLHDASEVKFTENENLNVHQEAATLPDQDTVVLHLPTIQPQVTIPVIELFL